MRATASVAQVGKPTEDDLERIVRLLEVSSKELDELSIRLHHCPPKKARVRRRFADGLERGEGWVETFASDLRRARASVGTPDGE